MNPSSDNHIQAKLFIGCLMNGEIKMHLSTSEKWKQASLQVQDSDATLIKMHFNQNDYIGYFSLKSPLATHEIKAAEAQVRNHLADFCPKLNTEKLKIIIFPLVFIT